MSNPTTSDLTPELAVFIRDALKLIGMFGFTWAQTVSGNHIEMAAGIVSILIGSGWSLIQKRRAKQQLSDAAAAPATPAAPKLSA